jgi:hypothetical protein
MTEGEWLARTDPWAMWEWVTTKADQPSDRKYLLLACACCRRLWHLLTDGRFRQAVEFTERYVDGQGGEGERQALDLTLCTLLTGKFGIDYSTMTAEGLAAELAVDLVAQSPSVAAWCALNRIPGLMEMQGKGYEEERGYQCGLLRDLCGNPFRPVPVDPAWRTSNVVGLARTVYDERAFDRMQQLADALEEAGCDDPDILAHCRQPGEHVRGCWVVDLLLGKQ